MRHATRMILLGSLVAGWPASASAQYFYSTLAEFRSPDREARQQRFSSLGEPPESQVFSTEIGSFGSTALARVAPGRIETRTTGIWDNKSPPTEGELPAGDGFGQGRALGFFNDFLTIDAAAPAGFLQVALTYNNDAFFNTDFKASEPALITAVYDIYYKFSAGAFGAETEFVDYNRRAVVLSFSTGFGFTIDNRVTDYLTGNFVSGQVFLVPFSTGEQLSITMTGDCTGTGDVTDIGISLAGCGNDQLFGWGGILGAVDADGRPIALRSVTSDSGADYLTNLSGLAFEPSFAVPEPAIWAQFILGFGLAGGFARRRRALAA